MSPELVPTEELADAYWAHWKLREALEDAREPRPHDPAAGDRIIAEGDGFQLIQHKRRPGEPDEPETGLGWAWDMAEAIASGHPWIDYDASEEGRPERATPPVDPVAFLVLLAERAPAGLDDPLGTLGADLIWTYLFNKPDIAAVEQAARRSEPFRQALSSTWYDDLVSPDDAARLRKLGKLGEPRWQRGGN
jgi:hypothetical protein